MKKNLEIKNIVVPLQYFLISQAKANGSRSGTPCSLSRPWGSRIAGAKAPPSELLTSAESQTYKRLPRKGQPLCFIGCAGLRLSR